ncbi:FHA domain-containing protein [Butyrivibrio sp. X503]|uniref:FHA domain-containing protein n=1 Tax=Butyrivibrio sp. X503 TaxID=2364878 RepID=UPI000EAAAC5C|nr:FHA domain-containing protein [Butyrivibrio sp. X503]RKM53852.1 FHA domain-containing protein [Butyrivibrio sp. X503]
MKKKYFKNHVLYEISEGDRVSNLGIKSVLRQKEYMLPIREITYNGKYSIICATDNLVKEAPTSINISKTAILIKSLSELLRVCSESAFLDNTYIDLSDDTIFFDRQENVYRFPLIPIDNAGELPDRKKWGDRLKAFLLAGMAENNQNRSLLQFKEGLEETDDIVAYVIEKAPLITIDGLKSEADENSIELVYDGTYGAFTLFICKDEFVIGQADDCDGVLRMNPTISRHHCKIRHTMDGWYVADLGSSNGTAVDDIRLNSNQFMQIHNGDRMRISDMEFMIQIG